MAGTRPGYSNTIITISYWHNLDSLHAYAHGPKHQEGWNWWNKVAREHQHLGILHEVYCAPKGGWENIYINCPPFGMGKCGHYLFSAVVSPSSLSVRLFYMQKHIPGFSHFFFPIPPLLTSKNPTDTIP